MTYREIIDRNIAAVPEPIKWWPDYAYHYTDVQNAVSILRSGYLYSRLDATSRHVMQNDNASGQVIDMTSREITSDVRLYFRPLTPTQYHNEGFKHPSCRYCGDTHANVPVPVFFLFALDEILSMQGVQFSEMSQAGGGSALYNSPEEFATLHFDQIYSNGPMKDARNEKKYRQAEILIPNSLPIDSALQRILCRNDVEKITLLNLLRASDRKVYMQFKDRIGICRENMFECNGLYISACDYRDGTCAVQYSDLYNRRRYVYKNHISYESLQTLRATIDFEWMSSKGMVGRQSAAFDIDYLNSTGVHVHNLNQPSDARVLYTRIKVEDSLLCYMGQQLAEVAML